MCHHRCTAVPFPVVTVSSLPRVVIDQFCVWDATTDTNLLRFEGHSDAVIGCSFSSDGTKLLSFSNDTTVRVWDVSGLYGLRKFLSSLTTTPPALSVLEWIQTCLVTVRLFFAVNRSWPSRLSVLEKVFRTVVEEMKKSDTKTALPLIAAAFKGYRNNLNHRSARFDVHPLLALRHSRIPRTTTPSFHSPIASPNNDYGYHCSHR
eukprot:c10119_g2_i2.p1 GENE.c10119_g2_i2~~c10119_g2_i2.p1  ORF type:complete len:205 (+),score=37.71 c10119_g2_i2:33-647(+)